MKKLAMAVAFVFAAAATGPAMAKKTTIEFKRDSGETQTVTLNGDGTAMTGDGAEIGYTYDDEALKMCFVLPDETQTCVVYAESVPEPAVGDAVRYTNDAGAEGTATVMAIEE